MRMQNRVIFGSRSAGSSSDDKYSNLGSPEEMAMCEWEERDDLYWPHEFRALLERYRRACCPQAAKGGRKSALGVRGGDVESARRTAMVALMFEDQVGDQC